MIANHILFLPICITLALESSPIVSSASSQSFVFWFTLSCTCRIIIFCTRHSHHLPLSHFCSGLKLVCCTNPPWTADVPQYCLMDCCSGRLVPATRFLATVCKWFALCYWSIVCLSVLSVCDVGVLWPNGWMDQDETWHGGRPRPRRHCVRWRPISPKKGGQQPPLFGPCVVAKRLDGSRSHLVRR